MTEENVKQHVVQAAYLAIFNYDNKYAHFKPRNRKINVTLKDSGKTFPNTIGDVAYGWIWRNKK